MTRTELEKYLGKKVIVTLNNRDAFIGILSKTNNKEFSNIAIPKNRYCLTDEKIKGLLQSSTFSAGKVKKINLWER